MSRITIEDIKLELQADGWELISPIYKNLKEPLECKCKEGHLVVANWDKLRKKRICPICAKNELFEPSAEIIPKKKGSFRLAAIDQATKKTGYAIFEDSKLIHYGVFDAERFGAEICRINAVSHWLACLIENWQIDFVALEGIQLEKNFGVEVFASLARLQGVLLNTAYEAKIQTTVCHTATWRNYSGVKGKTRVDRKTSMRKIVKDLYDVSVSDDESDAIGIGRYALSIATPRRELTEW